MPTLMLIRHGQGSFGTTSYDRLSATGEHQAEVLAAVGTPVQAAVSGCMQRQIDNG